MPGWMKHKLGSRLLGEISIKYADDITHLKGNEESEKGSFSFQSQRREMPKNVQITVQLHSFHILARLCSKSCKLGFNGTSNENFQMFKLDLEMAEE